MVDEVKEYAESDVVDDTDMFKVSLKAQAKFQSRHQLMMNIQNISKIKKDLEHAINRYATILASMQDHKDQPHFWGLGDYMIPVHDYELAMDQINASLDKWAVDLEKHTEQLKTMQKQHDGLTAELDILLEAEKGKFVPGLAANQRVKHKRNR